jgi:hypothetical protein
MGQLVELTIQVIYFDQGSSKVSRALEVEKVNNLAQFLRRDKIWKGQLLDGPDSDWTALIKGYASAEGDRSYNMEISQKRARAVRDMLIAQGVSALRLEARGMGTSPWAAPETAKNPKELEKQQQQNRRAEILLKFIGKTYLRAPGSPPPPPPPYDFRIRKDPVDEMTQKVDRMTRKRHQPNKEEDRGDINKELKRRLDDAKRYHIDPVSFIKSLLGLSPNYVDAPDDVSSGARGDD